MLFGPPPEGSTPEQTAERTCANCGATMSPSDRYCTNCGTMSPSAGGFCARCGTRLDPSFRFCTNCGLEVSGITGAAYQPAPGSYPVRFDVQYPEKLSRLLIFVKLILAIPQFLIVYALGSVISVVTFICFFAILFTGRYPRGLFNLVVGFTRWGANVSAYTSFMRDEYPPFSMDPGRYPVTFDVEYPERLSRWRIFFKWLLVIPNQIVVGFLGIVSFFLLFLSWWAILFTGRFPRGFFNFNVGVLRWSLRAGAYANLLRDEYPPYSMRPDARPSGWKAIAIGAVAGVLVLAAIVGGVVALATLSSQTHTRTVSYNALLAGQSAPPVDSDGQYLELLSAEDPYRSGSGTEPSDSRQVAFVIYIENYDRWVGKIDVSQDQFEMEDEYGEEHEPIRIEYEPPLESEDLGLHEGTDVTVVFEFERGVDPAELSYTGLGRGWPLEETVRYVFR